MLIYEKDKHPLIMAIQRDLFQKRINKLIVVTGGTQKGKSRLAVTLGWQMDKDFGIQRNVAVIKPDWFMRIINRNEPRGYVPIYDDCGLGINAQDWYDFQVQRLSRIMQIVGNRGYCVILTTPDYSFITSQVRKIVTDRIVVKKLYHDLGIIKFKYFADVHYGDDGTEYKSYPRKIYKNGKKRTIDMFRIKQAPKDVLDEFYTLEKPGKIEYTTKTEKEIKIEIERKEHKKLTIPELLEKLRVIGLENYVKDYKGRRFVDRFKIEADYGIGETTARRVKRLLEEELGINDKKPIVRVEKESANKPEEKPASKE